MEEIIIHSQFWDYKVLFPQFIDFKLEKDFVTIIDRKVWNLYNKNSFLSTIANPILLDVSEEKKSLYSIDEIICQLIERGIKKNDHLLAIGGGITQELTSFAASIYFRGIDWSYIPTTLLSQADSCLGGKNSLNVSTFKNMVGTFHPPREIFIFHEFLKTLDSKDLISGEIEMLKIHLLSGKEDYGKIKNLMNKELQLSSLKLKKKIIEQDEKDQGLRWKLNLGHSFGHALEASALEPIPHGIAVGFGILMGLEVSKSFGHLEENYYIELHSLLKKSLKTEGSLIPNFDTKRFREALLNDKKNTKDGLQLILCIEPGEVKLFSFTNEDSEKILNAALSLRL